MNRGSESVAAFSAAAFQDIAAVLSSHASTKSVLAFTYTFTRLKSALAHTRILDD